MTEKPISVFFSYSHKDEELRAELAKHLIILERRKVIHSWHDQEILAGAEKDDEIDRNLKTADIILLLVSVDFIASDYCYEIEVKLAMKRHNSGNACVIPILLRPVGFEGTPFEKLKSLPSNNQPVTRWESKDLAFQEISKEIEKVISNIRRKNSETLPVRPSKTLNQQGERRENIANNNPPASSQEDATSKLQEDKENKRIFCISTSQKNSNLFTIESLSREENLSLAWQRVLTSSNKDYKQLNLESYEAFGWNQKEKINLLSLEIRNETYSPSGSSKYYLPKNSGLVRPITVLSVKDQIFYQAVANLVCEARLEEIKRFRKNLVYGGFNIDSPKSIFFLSSWKDEYEAYKNTIRTKFDSGFQWICKFDLASFYDVIDHKILVEVAVNTFDKSLRRQFLRALDKWCKPKEVSFNYSQGIPQGPCASQALANIYLHHLDKKMHALAIRHDFIYLRYVDDIMLMGKDKISVTKGLIELDINARELSLIPQSGKTEIKKPNNVDEILKGENSLISLYLAEKDDETKQEALEDILKSSFEQNSEGEVIIKDSTNFKFSLFRLNPLSWAKKIVLEVLYDYPYLTDVCIYYLNKFDDYDDISESLIHLVKSSLPHDWCTAKILEHKLFKDQINIKEVLSFSFSSLEKAETHWILKRSLLDILSEREDINSILPDLLRTELKKQNHENDLPFYVSLIVKVFKEFPEITMRLFDELYSNGQKISDDFNLVIGYLMASRGYSYEYFNNYPSWFISNYFLVEEDSTDGITDYMIHFFKLPQEIGVKINLKSFLGKDAYDAALKNVCKAKGYYEREPELFILYSDSFHQVLLDGITQRQCPERNINGMKNMISEMKNLAPMTLPGLMKCHEFRNYSSRSTAYSQEYHKTNWKERREWLKRRKELTSILPVTYKHLIDFLQKAAI